MHQPERGLAAWAALVAAAILAICLARGAAHGVPLPLVHDEFSYLLQADTFVHGRLANPTPPVPFAFETFHVNMEPAYASKYPVGQGLFLALGWAVFGHPIVGVWLSAAALGAAATWCLGAVTSARTAAAVAFLACLQVLFVAKAGYWSTSYYGGAVAATGAALLWGGALRRRSWVDGLAVGMGLVLLATTRPFEGALAAIPVVMMLGWRAWRDGPATLTRVALAAGACLVVWGAFQALYDVRTTGSALTLPYVLYERRYSPSPLFVWQSVQEMPGSHPAIMGQFYDWVVERYIRRMETPEGVADAIVGKLERFGTFFFPTAAIALALGLPGALRRPEARLALGTVALGLLANLVTYFEHAHYFSPLFGPLLVLAAWSVDTLRAGALGRWVVWGSAALVLVLGLREARYAPANVSPDTFTHERLGVAASLGEGRHLVLVSYGDGHSLHKEWVYNGADLATEPVVWARATDDVTDARVVAAFPDRRAWRLVVDAEPGTPTPYLPSAEQAGDKVEPVAEHPVDGAGI